MTFRGHIKGGVVVLEGDVSLPEGTEVDVQPIVTTKPPGVWEKLLSVAGQAEDLPEDAAENIDHYLYGTPKR
jgi:hypothetical protein